MLLVCVGTSLSCRQHLFPFLSPWIENKANASGRVPPLNPLLPRPSRLLNEANCSRTSWKANQPRDRESSATGKSNDIIPMIGTTTISRVFVKHRRWKTRAHGPAFWSSTGLFAGWLMVSRHFDGESKGWQFRRPRWTSKENWTVFVDRRQVGVSWSRYSLYLPNEWIDWKLFVMNKGGFDFIKCKLIDRWLNTRGSVLFEKTIFSAWFLDY